MTLRSGGDGETLSIVNGPPSSSCDLRPHLFWANCGQETATLNWKFNNLRESAGERAYVKYRAVHHRAGKLAAGKVHG